MEEEASGEGVLEKDVSRENEKDVTNGDALAI